MAGTPEDILARIQACVTERPDFGSAKMRPHPIVQEVFARLAATDPNHVVARARLASGVPADSTLALEGEVIGWTLALFRAEGFEGQMTTGGTESNLSALWLAREALRRRSGKLPVVLMGDLTHYSVEKAAQVLGLECRRLPEGRDFALPPAALCREVATLDAEGRGSIVALTLGHTMTGTSDAIAATAGALAATGSPVHVHVDGAIGGLCHPFLATEPIDLGATGIHSLSVDFHKTGFAPFNAGVLLTRTGLPDLVAMTVPYVPHLDDTALLCSRSGMAAACCWAVIETLGIGGFRGIMTACRAVRDALADEISRLGAQVVSKPADGIGFAVCFGPLEKGALARLQRDFGLEGFPLRCAEDGVERLHHKIFVTNRIGQREVDALLGFLQEVFRVRIG